MLIDSGLGGVMSAASLAWTVDDAGVMIPRLWYKKTPGPSRYLSSPPTPSTLDFHTVLQTRPQNKDESHLRLGRLGHAEQRQRPGFAYRE